jgi:hypothetical protein
MMWHRLRQGVPSAGELVALGGSAAFADETNPLLQIWEHKRIVGPGAPTHAARGVVSAEALPPAFAPP